MTEHGTHLGRQHFLVCTPCRNRYYKEYRMGYIKPNQPTIGAKRRIQALMAIGWSQQHIAEAAGWESPRQMVHLMRSATMKNGTLERVKRAYDALSMTPGPSDRVRKHAAAKGYPGPLCWDEGTIDDPAAKPWRHKTKERDTQVVDEVLVQRALNGQKVEGANRAERQLIKQRWRDSGRPLKHLAVIQQWDVRADRDRRSA